MNDQDMDIKAGQVAAGSKGGSRAGPKPNSQTTLTPEERQQMMAVAAFYKAQQRGFAAGHEMDDWLSAEQEVKAPLEGLPAEQPLKRERVEEEAVGMAALPQQERRSRRARCERSKRTRPP